MFALLFLGAQFYVWMSYFDSGAPAAYSWEPYQREEAFYPAATTLEGMAECISRHQSVEGHQNNLGLEYRGHFLCNTIGLPPSEFGPVVISFKNEINAAYSARLYRFIGQSVYWVVISIAAALATFLAITWAQWLWTGRIRESGD